MLGDSNICAPSNHTCNHIAILRRSELETICVSYDKIQQLQRNNIQTSELGSNRSERILAICIRLVELILFWRRGANNSACIARSLCLIVAIGMKHQNPPCVPAAYRNLVISKKDTARYHSVGPPTLLGTHRTCLCVPILALEAAESISNTVHAQ